MAIQRLGWEFDFYAGRETLAGHVYCSICGKRRPTFRLGWKTRPNTYTGTHGAVPRYEAYWMISRSADRGQSQQTGFGEDQAFGNLGRVDNSPVRSRHPRFSQVARPGPTAKRKPKAPSSLLLVRPLVPSK